MNKIKRVIYRGGLLKDITQVNECLMTAFEEGSIPEPIQELIIKNRLYELESHGIHGQPLLANPIQYDKLIIEFEDREISHQFYNLDLVLSLTRSEEYRRLGSVIREIRKHCNQKIAQSIILN